MSLDLKALQDATRKDGPFEVLLDYAVRQSKRIQNLENVLDELLGDARPHGQNERQGRCECDQCELHDRARRVLESQL